MRVISKSYASGSQRMQSHHKMSEKFVTVGSPFLVVGVLLAVLQKEFMIAFIYLLFLFYLWSCFVCMFVCAPCVYIAQGSQKRV